MARGCVCVCVVCLLCLVVSPLSDESIMMRASLRIISAILALIMITGGSGTCRRSSSSSRRRRRRGRGRGGGGGGGVVVVVVAGLAAVAVAAVGPGLGLGVRGSAMVVAVLFVVLGVVVVAEGGLLFRAAALEVVSVTTIDSRCQR